MAETIHLSDEPNDGLPIIIAWLFTGLIFRPEKLLQLTFSYKSEFIDLIVEGMSVYNLE